MRPEDRRGLIPYKTGEKGSNAVTNLKTPAGRRIARIAAVGAVALVLAGAVASPAEASRRQAVGAANQAVGTCFYNGGDPNAYEYGGTVYVSCTWEDGSVDTLDFGY
jgi:hypothetical protein